MAWTCERCRKRNEDDSRYQCFSCKRFNPRGSEAHTRWLDWTCKSCKAVNGGGWTRCGRCDAKR
jgi:hypothetical protein